MDIAVLAVLRACDFALVAVGFALVFGSCRVLNLMHGSYVMLGAYAAYASTRLLVGDGVASSPVILWGVFLAAAATALIGFVFFKLLQVTGRTHPRHVLAISIAGNLFVAKVANFCYGTEGLNVLPIIPGTTRIGNVFVPTSELLIPLAAFLCISYLWWWLHWTRSGIALRAVADNPHSARLLGVSSDRVLAGAVGIAAFMAGLAGALRAPNQTLSSDMWIHPLLVSFAVVVFGGRNSLLGAVASAAFLGVVETLTSWFWSEAVAQYVALIVIVVGLVFLPTGLVGSPRYEAR